LNVAELNPEGLSFKKRAPFCATKFNGQPTPPDAPALRQFVVQVESENRPPSATPT